MSEMSVPGRRAVYAACKLHCLKEEGLLDTSEAEYLQDYLTGSNVYGSDVKGGLEGGLPANEFKAYHELRDILLSAHMSGYKNFPHGLDPLDPGKIWL